MHSSLALLLVPALVAASLPPMPALLWAGSESLIAPGSTHTSVSTSSLAQYVLATTGASSAPETLSLYIGTKTPEVVLVFVQPELQTSQLSSFGGAKGAFDRLKMYVEKSPSVTLPYVYASEGQSLVDSLASLDGVTIVNAENAVAFLEAHNEFFSNGKADVVVVKFPENSDDLPEKFAADDARMDEIVSAVSKASDGAYIAMFTASTPGTSALAQSIAIARQENVQLRANTHSKAKQNDGETPSDGTNDDTDAVNVGSGSDNDVLYMTPGILSGLLISLLLFLISICGIGGLMALQTPDQFEKEGGFLAGQ